MTHNEHITILVDLERLHRFVFDNFYIQHHQITDVDRELLDTYHELCVKHPNFREELWIDHLGTDNHDHINFNRYGYKRQFTKSEVTDFLDTCISSGKYIQTCKNIKVKPNDILHIEDILSRYDDEIARTKIIKLIINIK